MTRMIVLDDYQDVSLDLLARYGLPRDVTVERLDRHVADHDDLVERLAPFEIVAVMRERTPLPGSVIERLPRLRLILTSGPNNASIDIAAAQRADVVVSGTSSLIMPTVQLTWALILGLARHIVEENSDLRAGGWQTMLGQGLEGRTLGIIGLGRIGTKVAKIGAAFEMRVISWSPTLDPERATLAGVEAVEREEFFRQADIVTVHTKLNDRTRGLIGAEELNMMSPSAHLINTARGPIVDEDALVGALRTGRLAAAGIDVFAEEPLPQDHPFRHLPKVLATPHIGYVTQENYELFFREIAEDVVAFLDGAPIRTIEPPAS